MTGECGVRNCHKMTLKTHKKRGTKIEDRREKRREEKRRKSRLNEPKDTQTQIVIS